MAEENKPVESGASTNTDTSVDYIAAINELKQNSVDRSKYDQLRAENKQLLNTLVNGQQVETQPAAQKPDIPALRQAVFKEDQSNLDYVTNALKLRAALIENGEPDPFLPYGKKIVATEEDIAAANRVADVLQQCVDYAEGDSQVFTNELQRRTVDTGPRRKH